MHRLRLVENADENDILNWLDRHSVSVSEGLPLRLLLTRWAQAGRAHARLSTCLQHLIDEGWVAPVPRAEPPHLRFTPLGYQRLLEESTSTMLALEPFAAPGVVDEPATAVTPTVAMAAETTLPVDDSPAPPLFIEHGAPMTELGLRNQVLSIFRDLGLRANTQLIAVTLTRYWQEMGLRAGDLRRALDVVIRDGYLSPHRDGMDLYWQLTEAGEAWMRAPVTSQALLAAAPEVVEVKPGIHTDELRLLAIHVCARRSPADGGAFDYSALKADWNRSGMDENALLHALDLLAKDQSLEVFVDERQRTRLRLTPAGSTLASRKPLRSVEQILKLMK